MFNDIRDGASGPPRTSADPFPSSPTTPPRRALPSPHRTGPATAGWVVAGTPRGEDAPVGAAEPSPGRAAALSPVSAPVPDVHRPQAPPPLPPDPPELSPVASPGPEPRRGRPLAPRIVAGALSVVVLMAFVMVGVMSWGGDEGDLAQPETASTQQHTASPQVSTSRPARASQPASAGSSSPAVISVDPGPRNWELPEKTWDPLPQLAPADDHWVALQQSPVNDLEPVTLTGCPEPAIITDADEYRTAVRAQWDCLHVAWVPVYEALGWPTAAPAVEFYPGKGSTSECGYLEAPAFYCSAGHGTAYFGGDHLEMAGKWDLAVNEMVNHEYGHHIQNLAGITAAKQNVVGTDDIERRSELQATCWAGMMTYHNRSFEFGEDDYDSWQNRLETMLVDGVHGSRESLRYWGTLGLHAETLGDCNTWLVTSDHVS